MSKVSMPISNDYCPQTLFVYGTYDDEGKADFGLFCWFSYYWDNGLGVMACIGGDKLTKESIKKNKRFSANLVTEGILDLSDYFGTAYGYHKDKMNIDVNVEKGAVLDVPILTDSPLAFELQAERFITLDGGDVILCSIKNVLVDEALADEKLTPEQKLNLIKPVSTTCETYFGWDGRAIAGWHEPSVNIKQK